MERTAVLVLGHGSRRSRSNVEFESFVAAFRQRHPELEVGHAYIELAEPLLADELARLAGLAERVVILPVFLLTAGHLKDDVPQALAAARRAFPKVHFSAARAFGVHQQMVELVLERARSVLPPGPAESKRTVLLAVGRGSSDPDANGDFCKLVRLFGEGGGFGRSEPCFIAVTDPLFEPAAERLALSAPERVLVLPYFLFNGLLVEQLAEQVRDFAQRHPTIDVRLSPHLGVHPRLLELFDHRLIEALQGTALLPCDTCPRIAV